MRLACWRSRPTIADFFENCFGEMPKVRAGLALRVLRGKEIKKNGERFFCTSHPPVSRGELAAEPFAPLSFFFLRRSFFAVRAGLADSGIGLQRTRTQKSKFGPSIALANEADRFEYSGSWLAVRKLLFGLTFFPPSPLITNCRRHACLYNDWLVGNRIQLQQRNCSGFTPDFSRRSTVSNSQRTKQAIAACASALKIYLVRRVFRAFLLCHQSTQN